MKLGLFKYVLLAIAAMAAFNAVKYRPNDAEALAMVWAHSFNQAVMSAGLMIFFFAIGLLAAIEFFRR